MHITLTGNLGSGKSTICKQLEEKHQFEIFSTGRVQRTLAEEMGMSVLEMNQLMCKDHKYDHMIDDTTAKISRENQETNIVFDSRLAWHFVEKSFKVFLSVSLNVAAMRVYHDNRGNVESYQSEEDAKQQLKLRANTENQRYKEIYQLEYFDFSNYDLVLDSTYCSPELLTEVMLWEAKAAMNSNAAQNAKETKNLKENSSKILMSTKRLGIPWEKLSVSEDCYYLEEEVVISLVLDEYVVIKGMEHVKKAAKLGIPFVKVVIQETCES